MIAVMNRILGRQGKQGDVRLVLHKIIDSRHYYWISLNKKQNH
jgi:hypothetical protein